MEIIRGRLPDPREREYQEMMHYEGDEAEQAAAATPGKSNEPWENVIRLHEPLSHHALDWIIHHAELGPAVQGKILDIAAGTCWLTGLVSKLDPVEGVWALDLSERFLTETGLRIIRRLEGREDRIRFAVGDFTYMPFDDNFFDCAFLFSALHHSLAPVKLLREAIRCIRPGGSLLILESPYSLLKIRRQRRRTLEMSARAVTETVNTAAELKYIVQMACLPVGERPESRFIVHSLPTRKPTLFKKLARRLLRAVRLEDALKPATYVIQIIPQG